MPEQNRSNDLHENKNLEDEVLSEREAEILNQHPAAQATRQLLIRWASLFTLSKNIYPISIKN
jgi:hypothetical protein